MTKKRQYFVVRSKNDAHTTPWRDMAEALAADIRAKGRAVEIHEFTYDPDDPEDRAAVPMCEWHVPHKGFVSYGAFDKDAKRRMAAGQVQIWCGDCGHYLWADEFGTNPEPTDVEA